MLSNSGNKEHCKPGTMFSAPLVILFSIVTEEQWGILERNKERLHKRKQRETGAVEMPVKGTCWAEERFLRTVFQQWAQNLPNDVFLGFCLPIKGRSQWFQHVGGGFLLKTPRWAVTKGWKEEPATHHNKTQRGRKPCTNCKSYYRSMSWKAYFFFVLSPSSF